jgi:mRNA interferase RelE/StbE
MGITFSERARREWSRLERTVQDQLHKKLNTYLQSGQPLEFAERLHGPELGGYRFRVGDYRIVFDLEGDTIHVLRVGNRKDIYKK